MASIVMYLRIAEKLYNYIENITEVDFYMGFVAPCCSLFNSSTNNFTPPIESTHFYTKDSLGNPNPEYFYKQYLKNNNLSKEEYSFYMGYYCHLITDILWEQEVFNPVYIVFGDVISSPITYSIRGKNSVWQDIDLQFLKLNEDYRPYNVIKNNIKYDYKYIDLFNKKDMFKKLVRMINFYEANGRYLDFNCHDIIKRKVDNFVLTSYKKILGRLYRVWDDIYCSNSWLNIDLIDKNYLGDKKYYIREFIGKEYILEIYNKTYGNRKKDEFNFSKLLNNYMLYSTKENGECNNSRLVYSLFNYDKSIELSRYIDTLNKRQRYQLGYEAGKILSCIHRVSTIVRDDYNTCYYKRIKHVLNMFKECELKVENVEHIIEYIDHNISLLKNRPLCLLHGNYTIDNLSVSETDYKIKVNNLNYYSIGDPWLDFSNIVYSAITSPDFAQGQIDGYFRDKIPNKFFRLSALYIATEQISKITWALAYGDENYKKTLGFASKIFNWYNNFMKTKPSWYK